MKIRTQLITLVIGVIAPIAVLATLATIALWQQQRETLEQRFLERVSALRLALDAELEGSLQVLASISESADLDAPERLPSVEQRFTRVLRSFPAWALIGLVEPDGRPRVARQRGGRVEAPAFDRQVLAEVVNAGAPVISNLVPIGDGRFMTYLAVPVLRYGKVTGVLYAGVEHARWLAFLRTYPIAESATLTLNDRDGAIIARTLHDERWVGKLSTPQYRERTARSTSGAFRNFGLEGQRFYSAFSRSQLSGWTVGTGVPEDEIDAALSSTTLAIVVGVVAAGGVAFLFAWLLGGRITESLTILEATAVSVGAMRPAPDTVLPISEAETVRLALRDSAGQLREREISLTQSLEREAGARAEAERASRSKDEFLAMLSHELRNPLSAITSATSLLGLTKIPADSERRAREIILRQCRHLVEMIDDLMDVARLTSGKIVLHRVRIDLAEAVRRVVDSFQDAGRCAHLQIDLALAPVWIYADETRLEQVIANLLDNACKYTPAQGHVALDVHADGDAAVLSVSDSGVGIAADLASRIFDVFAQGERTLDRAQGGLGLGLAVVRNLVQLHGGTIGVASEGVGRGATFTLRFARAAAGAPTAEPPTVPAAPAPLRIAVVEDIADTRDMMHALLAAHGHRVDVAADGPAGVATILAGPVDAALVDLGLPSLDGLEVARRVRAAPAGRHVLLIALTGYGAPADREAAAACGFDGFLVKPFEPQQFEALLADLLRARRADASAPARP